VSRQAMIRLLGVSKSFGATKAVRDLDLELAKGKILALLGPSGCGTGRASRRRSGGSGWSSKTTPSSPISR
jgi:ABC-type transporter Mla maintaining outer membrane lipid asymmetry ATPase subunit MlaF